VLLALKIGGRVEGEVRDLGGRSFPCAVYLHSSALGEDFLECHAPKGAFQFEGLSPGDYRIVVGDSLYVLAAKAGEQGIVLAEEAVRVELDTSVRRVLTVPKE
jgi:hypothetical protein